MITAPPTPPSPDESQRLALRRSPSGKPVMFQNWRDLLFLHWQYPVAEIQRTLPEGLFVDTFAGQAFLGVVPFFMENVRPRFLPSLPGISRFQELNVRTYVHDRAGVAGVWFYSLDANQRLAVAIARRWFHLPYEQAIMSSSQSARGTIRYQSQRLAAQAGAGDSVFEYAAGAEMPAATPGSLEFFLIERYRLFAAAGGRLWRGAVFHQPYPLNRAALAVWSERPLSLNRFSPPGRRPDHIVMSRGVDVKVFALESVC